MRILLYSFSLITLLLLPIKTANSTHKKSVTSTGFIGLNTAPSARHDNKNTIRLGTSSLDPYLHAYIGLQISNPLYISIRQTAEVSNINEDAKALYPGVDIKLRLSQETNTQPEISIGAQSAFGHKRMAGEFIALSKRYNNLDFTAGLGWGRFATAKHLKNPLKALGTHFTKERNRNNDHPNTPEHWFTGEHIGLFGGVEYFTPIDGLSVKLDYGSDRYTAEKQAFNHKAPAPWSAGLSYSPTEWINAGFAIQGTDKIMSRLSLQSSPTKWPITGKHYDAPAPFYKNRSGNQPNTSKIIRSAHNDNITLSNLHYSRQSIFAEVEIPAGTNTPKHIGRAIRHISAHSGTDIEEIILTPIHNNLRDNTIKVMRSDVEKALDNSQGSPEEIWKNTEFTVTDKEKTINIPFTPNKGIKSKTQFLITQENQISLSEEDNGHLYRSSITGHIKTSPFLGFFSNTAFRLNIADNLKHLDSVRPQSNYTTKGNINAFTNERISVENSFIGYSHSLTPSWHTALTAGYLEEQYAGIGGEILYRPFSSRFAIGAEIHHVLRRDPNTALNIGLIEGGVTTGHANIWYNIPRHDLTLKASAGRFLATDIGIGLGLEKTFNNGARIDANLAISNYAESDIFGGTTHAYHGISLTLPLGGIRYIPSGSHTKTTIAPFGRNIAQRTNKPFNLYKETEQLTLKHIADHWSEILD